MAKRLTPALQQVKALTFDVFGAVVDWRGSISREGRKLGKELGLRAAFVQRPLEFGDPVKKT